METIDKCQGGGGPPFLLFSSQIENVTAHLYTDGNDLGGGKSEGEGHNFRSKILE